MATRGLSARLSIIVGCAILTWCAGFVGMAAIAHSPGTLLPDLLVPLVPSGAVAMIVGGIVSRSN